MARGAVAVGTVTASLVVLSGCGLLDRDSPKDDAQAFAKALSNGDLSGIPVAKGTSQEAQKWWDRTREGMGESTQSVRVESVEEGDGDTATATLGHAWRLAGSSVDWRYETSVRLVRRNDTWAVDLSPAAVAPHLADGERLRLTTLAPERGDILGAGDRPLVTERPVVRFGIDKTLARPGQLDDSARQLAGLLDIDAGGFADRVKAAGDKAFVEALVLRRDDVTPRIRQAYPSIPGARAIEDQLPLAPTRDFARAILGTVGPVTAEMVEKSGGRYTAGDVVGLGGLEQRYDERLRGRPGVVVQAVGEDGEVLRALFRSPARDGKPLRLSLDEELQVEAERALAGVKPASALVAVRPSTGEILAAAEGPGSQGYATATLGRYAPGSTFKVVSSLALLRAGVRTNDPVRCPGTTVVDGKQFKNYSDYPASALGTITLREAVAQSCNTAFISERDRVSDADVAEAAQSLGLGKDYDVGFPAFFGSLPKAGSETGHAAGLIGQGQVLASPMAMAAVAASVAAGETVVPHLLEDVKVEPSPSTPLTRSEAAQLRTLMAGVVEGGSGRFLADVPGQQVLAKTGTAEFGDADPPKTHAWMIASQGDLAVAVFVDVGDSGSRTAGPILEDFLRAARP
jgi:cell division protein FtsI/penicillin-binding protein 2